MGHDHAHAAAPGRRRRALVASLGANAVLLLVQVAGALLFGSLALLADSVHQASDVVGLVVALVALGLAARPGSPTYTYGLRRTETLGALVNAVLLLGSGVWIVVEATRRLGEPPAIDGPGVVALGAVGVAVNAGSAIWLSRVMGSNLNLRGAMLHLAYDAAGSVGVLIAGAAALGGADWVDPTVSLAIAVMVLWSGGRLVTATSRVLLEAAPIDATEVTAAMLAEPDVLDVHHVHLWSLDSESPALSAHVVVDRTSLDEAQSVSDALSRMLAERFDIDHATLALEARSCESDEGPASGVGGPPPPGRGDAPSDELSR